MSAQKKVSGLKGADEYYQDYCFRARELKAQGKKIIGYLCAFTPLEIITAAGFIPFRIKGDVNEPITKADSQMETHVCPRIRSCFDMSLKGNYEFLDGLVIPHACDSITRSYSIWRYSLDLPYSHFINVPHKTLGPSLEFFRNELATFQKSLENFGDKEITDDALAQAIFLYNKNRAKVKEMYEFRKSNPPLITGTEVTKVLVAAMGLPIQESIELLSSVIDEVKQRTPTPAKELPRIMVIGGEIDGDTFIKMIEDSGANVVFDELCPGTREHWPDIKQTENPMDDIAERYLKINCPRTCREKTGATYQDDLEGRFDNIGRGIKDFKVDGVVLYILKYCDPFGFEVPAMKTYIESLGTPVLYLEDEHSMATIARMRTRIQAFLEIIEQSL